MVKGLGVVLGLWPRLRLSFKVMGLGAVGGLWPWLRLRVIFWA